MSTPDQPTPPSGWGDATEPPRYGQRAPEGTPQPPGYGQQGQGQYGQGQYGQQYGQAQYGPRPPSAPGPYGPSATKPGVVPLRPLSLGEIYDGAFTAIRHNPKVMLGAATLVILVATVLGVLVAQLLVPAISSSFSSLAETDPELADLGFDSLIAQTLASSLGISLTMLLAQPVVEGLLTVSVSQSVIGRKLSLGEVWERLRGRVGRLIGWALLRALAGAVLTFAWFFLLILLVALVAEQSPGAAVGLGLLLGIGYLVLLVWLGVRVGLVAPALALEGSRLGTTIARAWRLTRGSFWRLFGIYLLAVIIVGAVSYIITIPISLIGGVIGGTGGSTEALTTATVVSSVVSSVISAAITTIFMASVVALLYIDVRMRREGLDVQLAAAAQASDGGRPGEPGPRPGPPPGMIA
ncbi:glycerophosphoryl diester phosphodiesterase membrane domain-containing protein [Krasilnikoviella flava]|uniref:Membrane domain of glycerophosphoryl diester phosphodiesterase n=1 Tax=Krasilnikoviella flava TaxID=526729 RepID=A0A1T5I981_9MICO|nr:glycerophosphoryl diester phosphodiesterase membrane domain-containing protein [Krasilnikoviella flava]SKC35731.1 Membrane domain of glycerophosphoryl diester phosphodiesterase [Krasilnikoviella flava]